MSSEEQKSTAVDRSKWILIIVLAVAVLALLALWIIQIARSDSSNNEPDALSPISEEIDQANPEFLRVGLATLSSCDAVLDYYKENALKQVTPWGLGLTGNYYFSEDGEAVSEDATESSSSETRHSTTNIQVEGVDETDIVKTDGDYIYITERKGLKIIDVRQADAETPPKLASKIDLDFNPSNMLLSLKPENAPNQHDTLIITGGSKWNQLRLMQINIDNRNSPEVIADFVLDGTYVGMRLAGNGIRLVITSQPLNLAFVTPEGTGLRAEEKALEANKKIIENSELSNWIPAYKDNLKTNAKVTSLVNCTKMLIPNVFSGLNGLSIIHFDASKKLTSSTWRTLGLAAEGHSIYATTENIYVATVEIAAQELAETDEDSSDGISPALASTYQTIIHKFGLQETTNSTAVARPLYMASGEFDGTLLNQFSMDEYKGDLRVAVTLDDYSENKQENHVKILRPKQGVFEEIGAVTGLGIDERIYAVRFMGAQAYLVTFRQIDPLYVLDLSNPEKPKALGELKIPGFSSYLHPVAENLLLGVGQEADEETGSLEGMQVSLFDTSDPVNPQRIHQLLLNDALGLSETVNLERTWSSSAVEIDHRAFLFYENSSFIPYTISWSTPTSDDNYSFDRHNEAGILVLKVKDNNLSVEKILKATSSEDNKPDRERYFQPIRTVVIGDLVYGVDYEGNLAVWQSSSGQFLYFSAD